MQHRYPIAVLGGALLLASAIASAQPAPPPAHGDSDEPALPPGLGEAEPPPTDEPAPPPAYGDSDEPELPPGLGEESEGEGDEPGLPPGLGGDEPGLPPGLGGDEEEGDQAGPALPPGLGDDTGEPSPSSAGPSDASLPFEWSAFLELRTGLRVQDDPNQDRISMDETRLQLHAQKSWLPMSTGIVLTADLVMDRVLEEYEPHLETGDGAIDLREAHLVVSPLEWMDVKLGRQALTWGTGDLLFINDLFPKDWNAFLIGRDIEYLKAPSDALRVSVFRSLVNADLVFTPRFDADRYPDRRRLSSWDPLTQAIVGQESELLVDQPDRLVRDGEWAGRLHRRIGRSEVAVYGYRGYWKSPAGFDATTGAATFPALSVYGASIRRPLWGGIAHSEAGYYDSRDDRGGENPLVRNSETRALVGFEREVIPNLTMSAQYYTEIMRHHGLYERSTPSGMERADRIRHLATVRLRYLAMDQNLELGLFGFVSPSDRDTALFPSLTYAISDEWKFVAGANVFWGQREHTFFGQLENNTNVYTGLRASWL